uniref:Coiled-coil domain containing 198 n=2 Tax=Monodelphis domestica TaxID=13616 RepID=A0A5F8GQQ7_MONDO
MGSKHSKAYPRVTKVAPIQDKCPLSSPVNHREVPFIDNLEKRSLYPFAKLQGQKKSPKQLPPLRETENGRYSSDLNMPRPMSFDISVEKRETSIIKKHPPRRFQIFEPFGPEITNAEKFLTHKGAETTPKKKQDLEKKMQSLTYSSGKRQYLNKMKMLEMNCKKQEAQAELKRNLHKDARINKHKAKKILENMQKNDSRKNSMTRKSDVLMNGNKGNEQNREFAKNHEQIEYNPRRSDVLRRWSLKQQVQDEIFWDSSSTSSDDLDKNERKSWGLLRTKTQRIPVFDELLDQERKRIGRSVREARENQCWFVIKINED